MFKYLLHKLAYGLSVLFGVITLVFFIFNLSPSDPTRLIAGQNDSEEVLQLIRQRLGLDLSIGERYALYLNDLSPVSIHSEAEGTRSSWEDNEYLGVRVFHWGTNSLALKWPYLRRSYITNRSVATIIADSLPGTAILAVAAISLALLIGIMLGIFSALNKDGLVDKLSLFISALGMSGPSFFMAIIIAWIGGLLWFSEIKFPWLLLIIPAFSYLVARFALKKSGQQAATASWYGLLAAILYLSVGSLFAGFHLPGTNLSVSLPGTGLNMTGSLYGVDVWKGKQLELKNLILPAITLGIRPLSVVVQLTRNSMLEVLDSDYIRTARAKGLRPARIIFVHALRNALNPVVTAISGWFASLLAGAVFVEFVFGWKGLGMEIFRALDQEDLPVVMGSVLVVASIFVFINILVDFIYAWLDPRVRIS